MHPTRSSHLVDILQEILYVENTKRLICQELLLVRENDLRQKLVYGFLCSDLDKHEILEQAAVLAVERCEDFLLKQLELFYKHCEGRDLLYKIRTEIMRTELYLDTIDKAIEAPGSISFIERRLTKEIIKYVLTQARYYNEYKTGHRR